MTQRIRNRIRVVVINNHIITRHHSTQIKQINLRHPIQGKHITRSVAAGLDKIKIASDGTSDVFTLNGVTKINLFDLGGVVAGDYVIVDYNNANAIADALSHFTITNPDAFGGASLINDTTNQDIVLHLLGGPPPLPEWNVDSSGSWGVASNWKTNS